VPKSGTKTCNQTRSVV